MQREQVPREVGVTEMGQDGDTQNVLFQNQTNGILGLQHAVTEPPAECQALEEVEQCPR